MTQILDGIDSPEDVKKLNTEQLQTLAEEIRHFLIDTVAKIGGHLASNLGVVELTLALHKVFSTPQDKLIWDVGHQSYVHKMLTGRKEAFHKLRQFEGLSGFPKTCESEHDAFNTGHSSTSISAAIGIAKARDLKNENHAVVAVIGDGALTGGMAFEALNDAGRSSNNLIVILNDNEMSIAKNVGGLSTYLTRIRTEPVYFKVKEDIDCILNRIPAIGKSMAKTVNRAKGSIKYMIMPGALFEELGFTYIGPIDGHNLEHLTNVLHRAKRMKGPILIHAYTTKGKGYCYAEEDPDVYHGISCFNKDTGKTVKNGNGKTYSEVFGKHLCRIAKEDEKVVAITAAMPDGTGLTPFSQQFPRRFFDVGIAEQHAVTFASGLASSGLKPVIAVYSSFLQRAYDQILHDVAVQNAHVVFAIDRAGVVGPDGETHQGIYDLSYLSHIPNMTILAPACYQELRYMLEYAIFGHKGPIAIRYPRGKESQLVDCDEDDVICPGKGKKLRDGKDVTLVAAGDMVDTAIYAASKLAYMGVKAEVINVRSIKPLDEALIIESGVKTGRVMTLENNTIIGGLGSAVQDLFCNHPHIMVHKKGFPDMFITHGSVQDLMHAYGLDVEQVVKDAYHMLQKTEGVMG